MEEVCFGCPVARGFRGISGMILLRGLGFFTAEMGVRLRELGARIGR